MELTKLYILEECLPKINNETKKVDLLNYEGVRDIGASNVKLHSDDVAVLVDISKASEIDESYENNQPVTFYWFRDGTEIHLSDKK
ncbi:hypothetical protein Bp8pS_087 [Bacillus phage vB_BpuM-BpSp]|nr:hypothetical protein Bp8pS_087 [Bacillus phage vB_BpuM-BpSp]